MPALRLPARVEAVVIRILSLGAGVQSTTLALMAQNGALDKLDCAIFADTGDEPADVYAHLERLKGWLSYQVHVVRAWEQGTRIKARMSDEIIAATNGTGGSHCRPPLFTLASDGSKGMVKRQCTQDYKIAPIERKVRELLGLKPRARWPTTPVVEQWIGISTDEASRMKPSRRPAITTVWPLIDKGMSRRDCLAWLTKHGFPQPPKSACIFCPFHSDKEWRRIKDTDPAGWARAVEVDEAIRTGLSRNKGLDGALFLHAKRIPLRLVDMSTAEERGQINLFENECAGVCGV